MSKPHSTITICIRTETQLLINEIAAEENRSRSAMIDVMCMDWIKQYRELQELKKQLKKKAS